MEEKDTDNTVLGDVKALFKVRIKDRKDSLSDHYHRIFMVKIVMAICIISGMSWFNDDITCLTPDSSSLNEDSQKFVNAACWIQGLYVYRDLMINHTKDTAYFGMPKDINHDGMLGDGKALCATKRKYNFVSKVCKPMKKTFYLQYQWFPFYIGALGILYYMPYILFNIVNKDVSNLQDALAKKGVTKEKILKGYFFVNGALSNRVSVLMDLLVKVLYICSHISAYYSTDALFNGGFADYGSKWLEWLKLENWVAHDYMGLREFPKPGNNILPGFGYCDIYESAQDVRNSLSNNHKLICELSQHILYQYCLIVLWFAIIVGLVVSVLGFVYLLLWYILLSVSKCKIGRPRLIDRLLLRERVYLKTIHSHDAQLHQKLVEVLMQKVNSDDLDSTAKNTKDEHAF